MKEFRIGNCRQMAIEVMAVLGHVFVFRHCDAAYSESSVPPSGDPSERSEADIRERQFLAACSRRLRISAAGAHGVGQTGHHHRNAQVAKTQSCYCNWCALYLLKHPDPKRTSETQTLPKIKFKMSKSQAIFANTRPSSSLFISQ